jgi:hypothetical protein
LRTSKGLNRKTVPSQQRCGDLILGNKLAEMSYRWCAFWSQGLTTPNLVTRGERKKAPTLDVGAN